MSTTPGERPILSIDWDDLNSAQTEQQVTQMRQAQNVPLVRTVGVDSPSNAHWYRKPIVQMSLAGLIGGLLSWLLIELFSGVDNPDSDASVGNIITAVMVGLAIGLVLALWDGLSSLSVAKIGHSLKWAAPILLGTSLVGGLLVNAIYVPWTESILDSALQKAIQLGWGEDQTIEYVVSQLHLARGVAWAVLGITVGVGLGLASRQPQRALNGAIGGGVGGFIGGFLFDYFTSGPVARGVGLAITGVAIGLSIGLVEVARRQYWLEIVTGGMAGKQFIVYGDRARVGAAPDNDITLIKDPGIAPTHMILSAGPRGLTAEAADPSFPLLVNGAAVHHHALSDSDTLQLGATTLRYRDKAESKPIAQGIVG